MNSHRKILKSTKLFAPSLIVFILFFTACNNEPKLTSEKPKIDISNQQATPVFNSDTAYEFIKKQVDFGPRVPGTPAHGKCADYLVLKLKSYGMETTVQRGTVQTFDKNQFVLKNIIASFKPDAQSRILLCAHWDTRPFADSDTKDKDKPIDGANDGASGVGIALEVARQLNISSPNIGVDIIFFDIEDYGTSGNNESWCLGSQFWAKNIHKTNYYANFGILLDMVAGANATFPKEFKSVENASAAVDKIWKTANDLGFGNYFLSQTKDFVGIDDHIYVSRAGIPCVDIIEYNQLTGGFGSYHHTHQDNMSLVDKNTLNAVGQTLLEVIYKEK